MFGLVSGETFQSLSVVGLALDNLIKRKRKDFPLSSALSPPVESQATSDGSAERVSQCLFALSSM